MNTRICPLCGQAIDKPREPSPPALGASWRRRDTITMAMADSFGPGASWEHREASRKAETGSDVVVPFLQSLVTGTGAVLVVGVISRNLEASIVGGVIGFVGTWVLLLQSHRALLWRIEAITGRDLDNDNNIGKPTQPDPPVILRAYGEYKSTHDTPALPELAITRDASSANRRLALDLSEFLAIGARDDDFTLRSWAGRTLSTGTKVSDPQWRSWVGHLRDAGILSVDNSGTKLAVDLDAALRSIIH